MPHKETYGFWTNKGGVGKTTLCFHTATAYANLYPYERVVVLDCDPISNISVLLLTTATKEGSEEAQQSLTELKGDACAHLPKTVGGYFASRLDPGANPMPVSVSDYFLLNVSEKNSNVPPNVYLLAGDAILDSMAVELNRNIDGPAAGHPPVSPYVRVHNYLNDFVNAVCKEFDANARAHGCVPKPTVFFVDCNPALSIYTEIALCSIKKLIIPLNADDFSKQAIGNMFRGLYGMYMESGYLAGYEEQTFALRRKRPEYGGVLKVPQIHAIVHNQSEMHHQNDRVQIAFQTMNEKQVKVFWEAFQDATLSPDFDVNEIFHIRGGRKEIKQLHHFANHFTGTMRNMGNAIIASHHFGLPLWCVGEFQALMTQEKIKNVRPSVGTSIQDLTGFGGAENRGADLAPAATFKPRSLLELIGDREISKEDQQRLYVWKGKAFHKPVEPIPPSPGPKPKNGDTKRTLSGTEETESEPKRHKKNHKD